MVTQVRRGGPGGKLGQKSGKRGHCGDRSPAGAGVAPQFADGQKCPAARNCPLWKTSLSIRTDQMPMKAQFSSM